MINLEKMIRTKMKVILNRYKNKSKFLFFGIINIILTQIILALCLLFFEVSISTFISQLANVFIGYNLYSRYVFNYKKIFSNRSIICYVTLSILSWNLNWFLIYYINFHYDLNKNLIAILVLPLLVLISYSFQRNIIFNK